MKIPNPSDIEKVLEKINEIAKKSATGDYIYRGSLSIMKKSLQASIARLLESKRCPLISHVLGYLEKHHRISIETIYNDLHGFIRRSAHAELLKGFACQRKAKESETDQEKHEHCENAIKHYTKALKLKDDYAIAYNNRGNAYREKGEVDWAIQNLDKAIELNPEYATAYFNRGGAWLHLRDWQKAKDDLTPAKDMGINIVASFHTDYKSVEDFEAKHEVKLPEDLAALLREE